MADCFSIIGCPGSLKELEEPNTKDYTDEKKDDWQQQILARIASGSPIWGQNSTMPAKHEITHLPILIIPGFMSSGLEIKASQTRPDWVGKRVWLNLGSLGLSALYFGSAQKGGGSNTNNNNDDEQQQQQQQQRTYKSFWLEHMRLNEKDLCSDPPGGVQVRAIEGLEGVDYLTPGALTNHVSYVFGPVIAALLKDGYQEGTNLQAAPYDWRLPPLELERRDRYFSRVVLQVEELYRNNHGTPVVLLGHSLGTKTAHYFLNFARLLKGQAWIDKHIHTYLPVGAPHLGAPKALRSSVAGDKMSLDAFLSDEEALALGRSFGSGPWLFPATLPAGVPSSVYVLPHGVLEVSFTAPLDTQQLVYRRTSLSKPNRYQVIVGYGSSADRAVQTPFTGSNNQDRVTFNDKISFATHAIARDAAAYGRLTFFLQEPGIGATKEEVPENTLCCVLWTPICCVLRWITCCCICDYIYRLIRWILCGIVLRGVALSADAITSGAGGGSNLAFSHPVPIPSEVWRGQTVTRKITLYHKDDYEATDRFLCFYFGKDPRVATLQVQIRWIPYDKDGSIRSGCSPICAPNLQRSGKERGTLKIKSKDKEEYQELAGHDILEREGLDSSLQLIKGVYDADATIGPRTLSSSDAPPVQRIHAIYGINLKTEVGAVYRRKDRCLSDQVLKNLYKLDFKASIATTGKSSGYALINGILYETRNTKQAVAEGRKVSGDGTVPYWSLQHCKTWKSHGRDVTVVELENAEHREILADQRFHKAILEYCRIPKESV